MTRHKHLKLDQSKIDRAKKLLGAKTEQESAVVQMELRVGATTLPARRALDHLVRAYEASGRHVEPRRTLFAGAGRTLQLLRESGREIRRASLVGDVLIAHTARSLGAAVLTGDRDFEATRAVLDFELEMVGPL